MLFENYGPIKEIEGMEKFLGIFRGRGVLKGMGPGLACLLAATSALSGCGRASADTTLVEGTVVADTTGSVQQDADAQTDQAVQENSEGAASAGQMEDLLPLNIIDDKFRTTYEIFVYSFYDSDGDGVGDLNGVTKKLDYINDGDDATDEDLGCNEIWLMPICPSPTYHKYDVTDYMDIDPEYGTLEDFDKLIDECHKRGIRVILDTVINHSSSEHPWFKEAAGYLKDHPGIDFSGGAGATLQDALSECPYLDYYTFSNDKQAGFEPLPETDYFYEARFWSGMPDLNLDSRAVRDEISEITDFWLDRGVDGFRLDATTYYYTGDDAKNIEFMTWLNDTVKSRDENAYIVGEAWVSSATYHKYYESGIDSFFDFDYAGSEGVIASVVRGNSPATRYSDSLSETEKSIASVSPDAVDAPFYTNHDMARSAGYYTGSLDKVKLAQGLNLLMAGNAFIYYGEELGMKGSGKDENKRAPMYWTADGKAKGMCRGPKAMDSFKMKYPPADEQADDPYSIYNYVKRAVRLRNTYPVIARGRTTTVSDLSDKDICAFTRAVPEEEAGGMDFGTDSLLIVINTSAEAKSVDLSAGTEAASYVTLAYDLCTSEERCVLSGKTLTIPAYGIAVLTE